MWELDIVTFNSPIRPEQLKPIGFLLDGGALLVEIQVIAMAYGFISMG